jgi:hypothetical protein
MKRILFLTGIFRAALVFSLMVQVSAQSYEERE